MASTPSIMRFFETPLIIDRVEGAGALNAQLRDIIDERRRAEPGLSISNQGGWHSDTGMLEWGGPAAFSLVERIVAVAERFTVDIGMGETPRFRWIPEMWANVSGYGASNQYHCHPGAYWAAVYYVDDGYAGSEPTGLGGEIAFEDPRMPMVLMEAPDLQLAHNGPASGPTFQMRPETGALLLFPAWLRHSVNPYFGQGERISIAVNLTAIYAPAETSEA